MSHITQVQVAINKADIDSGNVLKALQMVNEMMGLEAGPTTVRAINGDTTNVDYRVTPHQFGLAKNNDGTYDMVGEFWGSGFSVSSFRKNLTNVKLETATKKAGWHKVGERRISNTEREIVFEVMA